MAVFVGLSIVLLTAYFGESPGGVLHALQKGTQEALAPIESGASRALKPVRDLFGWFGDTIDAKDENEKLKDEVERLRQQVAEAQTAKRDAAQLRGIVDLRDHEGFPQGTDPLDRAGYRPLAHGLVLEHQDRQGVRRRRPGGPAGDRRGRPGRQGHARDRRHRGGHADHRRLERGLGAGDAGRGDAG